MKLLIIIMVLSGEPTATPSVHTQYVSRCPTYQEAQVLEQIKEREAASIGLDVQVRVNCYKVGRPIIM